MDDDLKAVNDHYKYKLRSCHNCGDVPVIDDNGSAAQKTWYVECECGCRGPAGLAQDAVDGWNSI